MRKADERESIQSPIPGVPGDEQWLDKFEQELGDMTKRLEDLKRKRAHEESPRKRPAMEGTPQDNPMAGEHNEHLGLTEWSVGSRKQQITISKVDKDKERLRAVQISNIKEVPMQQLYRALINMFGTPTLGFTAFTEQAKKGKVVLMTTAERMRAVLPIPGEKEVISVQLESTTIMAEAVEVPEAVVGRHGAASTNGEEAANHDNSGAAYVHAGTRHSVEYNVAIHRDEPFFKHLGSGGNSDRRGAAQNGIFHG